jgi:hypothetical protein
VSESVAREGIGAVTMRERRINTTPQCYSHFFGVAASRAGLRIRNDEVVGSIPTSSTKCLRITKSTIASFVQNLSY